MATFKRFRSLGLLSGLFFAVCMLASLAATAQTDVEATVLTTNVDVQRGKLYVEMNYTPRACGTYQLRFKLTQKDGATPVGDLHGYAAIALDSVITNDHGSSKIASFTPPGVYPIKVLNLDNTAVGGYSLRFELNTVGAFDPATIVAEDSFKVCLEIYRTAYRCKYCGSGGTDLLFTAKDIKPGCPYPTASGDLVACSQRGGAANWEAYIQDPRDCKVYRTVQMPNGSWWFAQNLSYQVDGKEPINVTATGESDSAVYFCPGVNGETGAKSYEGGTPPWSCTVYGALYPPRTAMLTDGSGARQPFTPITDNPATSAVRGVCPPGWFIPNDADWGIMLNAVEGCAKPDTVNNKREPLSENCNHFTSSNAYILPNGAITVPGTTLASGTFGSMGNLSAVATDTLYYYDLGKKAGASLKAIVTCPPIEGNAVNCDNNNGGAWTPGNTNQHHGLFYAYGSPSTYFASTRWGYVENRMGNDHYGFSAIPAGYVFRSASAGRYDGRGQYAVFMSSTYQGAVNRPVYRLFSHDTETVRRFYLDGNSSRERSAFSVRCTKR